MTSTFKTFGDSFISDVETNNYYLVGSGYSIWSNSDSLVSNDDFSVDAFAETKKEILFGYKLSNNDLKYLFLNNKWIANTQYDEYSSISNNMCWVITSSNSVYKCLDNANTKSTVEPTNITLDPFVTSDGYKWIYIFSIDDYTISYFGNSTYLPVIYDSNITSSAVSGTIDKIEILTEGSGYFSLTGNVSTVVSNTLLKCNLSNTSISNNDLTSYGIYVKTGGATDSIFTILGNYTNSIGTYITSSNFNGINTSSTFVIAPLLNINGDGNLLKVQPVVNSISTGISDVYIIDRGDSYTYCNVSISNTYSSNIATFRTNLAPAGGHSSDPAVELNSSKLLIMKSFDPTQRDQNLSYRRVGLLKNPNSYMSSNLYSNATFLAYGTANLSNISGSFSLHDVIAGNTSNAEAEIIFANTSHIIFNYLTIDTEFLNNELISSNSSSAIISSINNPDIKRSSGDLIGFKNFNTISYNTNTYSEDVSLVIYKE